MNEIDSAVKDLTRRRKSVMDTLAETELGRALVRIDAALAALAGEDHPVASGDSPSRRASGSSRKKREPTTGSVRSKAQTLLDEADRTWGYDAILAEWQRRGDPIKAADPKAALRTALWAMVKSGDAIRVEGGLFKSSKFAPEEVT